MNRTEIIVFGVCLIARAVLQVNYESFHLIHNLIINQRLLFYICDLVGTLWDQE